MASELPGFIILIGMAFLFFAILGLAFFAILAMTQPDEGDSEIESIIADSQAPSLSSLHGDRLVLDKNGNVTFASERFSSDEGLAR